MARGRQIAAILMTAFGLFSFFSLFFDATGQIGALTADYLRRAAGWVAAGPALIVVWLGVRLYRGLWDAAVLRRLLGFTLVLLVASIGLHLYYRFATDWPAAWSPREEAAAAGDAAGGMVGGLLAGAFMRLLGPLGTGLAGAAAVAVAGMLLVDQPVRDAWARLTSKTAAAGDNAREARAKLSRRRRTRDESAAPAADAAEPAAEDGPGWEPALPKEDRPPAANGKTAGREASGGRSRRRPARAGGS
ncbi:MAG: DNA translocase FtsK 4TM domain-containing protein, partial [Limnochordales bacterium]